MKKIISRIFLIAVMLSASACVLPAKYPVDFQQAKELGFDKQEMIRLGQLINIAYALFSGGAEPQNPNPPFPEDFEPGFTPIANLQGRDNPSSEMEFYGHLSWMDSEPGTMVISIRGTSDAQEWVDDVRFVMVKYSDDPELGRVEKGFNLIFRSFTVSKPGDSESTPLGDYLGELTDKPKKIIVTGHSLGSSLAVLVAFDASLSKFADQVSLLTFASPLTGNAKFVKAFQARIKDSVRVVNRPDIVPRVPPPLVGYRHVWHELEIDSYPDAGIVKSVGCFHSLLTYLHLLDSELPLECKCAAEL